MLRVGVIGTGVMGAEHARLLRDGVGGARLAAVSDVSAERAQAVAQGAQVTTDALELIAGVDAVVIASPDATHEPYVRACLDAGTPVLCEKPLAPTAAQARALVDAEIASGRRLVSVGFMRRFDPGYLAIREARRNGTLGEAVLLHHVHRNAAAPDYVKGASVLTNAFVHEIDITRFLLEEEPVSAQVTVGPGGDPLLVTMQTTAGTLVSTELFMNAGYGYQVHAQLVGREATVEMSPPGVVQLHRAGRGGYAHPGTWIPRFAEAYRAQLEQWVHAARDGGAVGASAWDGYLATATAERIVTVMDSGERVALPVETAPDLYRAAR